MLRKAPGVSRGIWHTSRLYVDTLAPLSWRGPIAGHLPLSRRCCYDSLPATEIRGKLHGEEYGGEGGGGWMSEGIAKGCFARMKCVIPRP